MKKISKMFFIILLTNVGIINGISQTSVTNICDDGTFETSNLDNTSWTLIPYNRVMESYHNHQNPNLMIFKTNGGLFRHNSKKITEGSFNWQSASKSPWWGIRAWYRSNNSWEIIDKTNSPYDYYFAPGKSGPVLNTTFGNSSGSIRLGSHIPSSDNNNDVKVKDGILTSYEHRNNFKEVSLSASTIAKKIHVTSNSFIVNFKYAAVFKEYYVSKTFLWEFEIRGGASPFFGVRVIDETNNSEKWLPFGLVKRINSNTYHSYSSTNPLYLVGAESKWGGMMWWAYKELNPTGLFHRGESEGNGPYTSSLNLKSAIYSLPWQCGKLDLSEYIGKTIRLEFVVADHSRGNGFAYAYIDDICVNDNFCGNTASIEIMTDKTCGPDALFSGHFVKPIDHGNSGQGTTVYYSVSYLDVSLYKNGFEEIRVRLPSANIKENSNNEKIGSFFISSSVLYDALYSKLISNSLNEFDIVAHVKYNDGNITPTSSKIDGFNPGQDNDWSYCCDTNRGVKNEKDNINELSNKNCKLSISLDRNIIDFPPASKYNYYNLKSQLYDKLLRSNFDYNSTDGFFNWPSKIDSFNYHSKSKGYDCENEIAWYEIFYKHKACDYYSKIRVESTCKVPLSCENVTCQKKDSITLNPYLSNLMGNWRPSETYVYNVKRQEEQQNVRYGEYLSNSYVPAYVMGTNGWQLNPSNSLIQKDKVLNYDLSGNMVENKNPLNIYSAKKYAYNNTHPHLVASNSTFQESVYYSFESLDHNKGKLEFKIPHNVVSDPFYEKINKASAQITNEASHSGTTSYKVMQHAGISPTDTPYVSTLAYFCGSPPDHSSPNYKMNFSSMQVRANDNTFKPVFDLVPGKEYTLTYWVKNVDREDYGLGYIGRSYDCDRLNKRILVNTGAPNIEGWYKVSENFIVPAGAKLLKLVFYPGMSGSYFDDIRILPSEANMKSYVYDVKNRMTAELDENNYATFFDYDDQGNLIRVRKETERGIITINESRIYLKDQ